MSERQQGNLETIRIDHKARYHFACDILGKEDSVLDAGCGCGYGSFILSGKVGEVCGVDNSREAIEYANENYYGDSINYWRQELPTTPPYILTNVDAVVCFEVIQHVKDPLAMLKQFRDISEKLVCSVPNELAMPFSKERFPFHHRHYTKNQFNELLAAAGWRVIEWRSQANAFSKVEPESITEGRTLVAVCV